MNAPLGTQTKAEVVRIAARAGSARLRMKGRSMLPDLREGMTLEVGEPDIRVGRIAVFQRGSRIVAHRILRIEGSDVLCAGDAQPAYVERVSRSAILGVVTAAFDEDGRRIDGALFALRGMLRCRSRGIRAFACAALPPLRGRIYGSLLAAMSAAVRGDAPALRDIIPAQPLLGLAELAKRHRCAAALSHALEAITGDEYAASLQSLLRKERWQALLRRQALREQALRVAEYCARAGVEPILLKGAYRAVTRLPEADLYDSADIDVLVPASAVDSVCGELLKAGYQYLVDPASYQHHHHAAPMQRAGALPVEVHHALYPAQFGFPNSYAELLPYTQTIEYNGCRLRVLNNAATALHLAVHCLQRPALRELVLLAMQLRRLDEYECKSLRGWLERERRYGVAIGGALAVSARIAGLNWAAGPQMERYAEWMIAREDLPRPLRARTVYRDARLARLPMPRVGAARCALYALSDAAISAYLRFMRR